MDTLLEMAGVSLNVVVIGIVGGLGDMNWEGGLAGTTGTAKVDSSSLGAGAVASLSLCHFLHGRGVFFQSCHW